MSPSKSASAKEAPDAAILALFTRAEGCTARQYADAMGVTRQAAAMRLRRFVELGLLTVSTSQSPTSFADLAKHNVQRAPARQVYRAAKVSK